MKNKGISLIVLVVTIIVIIILAGTVILSLSENNPIKQAEEAKFKSDVNTYNSELALAMSNEYLNDRFFDPNSVTETTSAGVREYISSMTLEVAEEYEIRKGKLVYIGGDTDKQMWAEDVLELGSSEKTYTVVESVIAVDTIATVNSAVLAGNYAYANPVIPVDFKAVNTVDANWNNDGSIVTDWNKGLVIQDVLGNQFVWVPVKDGIGTDGTYESGEVQYEKWVTVNGDYFDMEDLSIPVENETSQISKYGGFYVARYEAGQATGDVLVSKSGETVWNSITQSEAKTLAEGMYNTAYVKSGLVTGTMWDTMAKWIEESGKDVTVDSTSWGNYPDSSEPANITGFGSRQDSGFSDYWKAKNIYDLAGNLREWSNEVVSEDAEYEIGNCVNRSGCYNISGNTNTYEYANTMAYRSVSYSNTDVSSRISFRVVLYVI